MHQDSVLTPILYSLYINGAPRGTWNSSCSVRGRYLYLRDRETRLSCSLQTATRPHCSEFAVWKLEHKDQWRKGQEIYFSRRLGVPDDVLNGEHIPFVNNVTYLGVTFDRRMTWRQSFRKDYNQGLARVYKDVFLFQKWAFKYRY
jgi:hypothetical protein